MKHCGKFFFSLTSASLRIKTSFHKTCKGVPVQALQQTTPSFRNYASIGKSITYAPETFSPEAAIKECDLALSKNPNDIRALNAKAEAFLSLKNWKGAMETAAKALAVEEKNGTALRTKATCLHNMGNIGEALKVITTACEVNEKDGPSHLLKGILLATSGNLNDALAQFNTTARLDPKNPEAHYERGRVLRQMKDNHAALAAFNKALKLDPTHVNSLNMKAVIQCDQKEFDEALATWDEAINCDSTSSALLANKAKLLVRIKRYPAAAETLRKAIKYDGEKADGSLRVILGECLMQMGNLEEASTALKEATQLSPKDATAYALLGQALHQRGHLLEALDELTKACDIATSPQPAWLHTRGQILHRLGKDKEAIEILEKLIAEHPESSIIANSYVLLGGVHYHSGRNVQKAMESFDAAIAKDPDVSDAYASKAQLLDESQDHPKALENWNKAIELKIDDSMLFTNRGKCLSRLQKFPEAEKDFESAITLKPKDAEAYKALGVCKWMQGKPDEAFVVWSKGAQQDTEDVYIHYLKGVYLHRNNKFKEALACLDTALKIGQEQGAVPMEVEDLRFQVFNILNQRPRS